MDLVQEAGLDVSDWGNYADGTRSPAANPKYCYEWAYVQPGQVVILNLWHEEFQEGNDIVKFVNNSREAAEVFRERGAKQQWIQRAQSVDAAVQLAYTEQLPIRVVVLAGRRRDRDSPDLQSARVTKRRLDPVPWAVQAYDTRTGQYTLVRGLVPLRVVDQFELPMPPDSPARAQSVLTVVYVRDPLVRREALRRAGGKCEWCGQQAFELSDGSLFLETHHIVPLSEDGPDIPTNVAAVCPNHHREAHYGKNRDKMRAGLIEKIGQK
jgi:5-methylcytosine-specific restriction protein A